MLIVQIPEHPRWKGQCDGDHQRMQFRSSETKIDLQAGLGITLARIYFSLQAHFTRIRE
jgi:hypothetical protein